MRKDHLTLIAAVLLIVAIGFLLRIESAYVTGTPVEEKSFYLDQNNLPYMYELDSYYNYRLTLNYLEHGFLGDVKIHGREWDFHSYSPSGVPLDYPPLIVFITAFIYKLVNFVSNVPLIVVCFWLPAFIAPLAGVATFIFTRRLTNDYGALVAGILMVLAPFYFTRSVPGWFDTDIFVIFFPIIIVWLFWEASINKSPKRSLLISVLAGLVMSLFAVAWNGWQYYFYLLTFFGFLWTISLFVLRKPFKQFFVGYITFIGVTLILVCLFSGYLNILKLLYGPLEFINLSGSENIWSPWPDVYVSVNELVIPTIGETFSGIGLALFAGILGLIWGLKVLVNDKDEKIHSTSLDWFIYLLLALWALTGFLALFQGSRFIMILIPPLTISTGIMVGICIDYLNQLKNNRSQNRFLQIFRTKPYLIQILIFLIVLVVTIPSFSNISKTLEMSPGTNDDAWNSLEWINYNTPENTVVFSNWPSGHLIAAVANRSVSLDGRMAYIETVQSRNLDNAYTYGSKSPSTAREYWISHAFSTSNETLSAGIFRMLASSGDMAYLTLDNYTGNTTQSVEILNNILGVDNKTAHNIMVHNYNLSQSQAQKVLLYTHPKNPTPYVLWTHSEMFYKGFWIFHFGNWNFDNNKGTNYTYKFMNIDLQGDVITTNSGLEIDLNNGTAIYKGEIPYCVIISGEGGYKRYLNEKSGFCVVVINNKSQAVIIDKRFENSLYTKLALENKNSTYFKSLYKNYGATVWGQV